VVWTAAHITGSPGDKDNSVDIYDEMMDVSRRIAAFFPVPQFYGSCGAELATSKNIYQQNPLVSRCRTAIAQSLARNPSHGPDHAEKVAVEAGALVLAEEPEIDLEGTDRNSTVVLAQVAGLLHDMRRGDKDHARTGAAAADLLLDELGVPKKNRQYIVQAIASHEAFTEPPVMLSATERLLSNVLYDADKFRWGPDNFTITLWEMLRFAHVPVATVIPRYQQGMAGISRIKDTFRSRTGRAFGPEFIDLGLSIGNRIYRFLLERFAEDIADGPEDNRS
jgi:hypothetical protein